MLCSDGGKRAWLCNTQDKAMAEVALINAACFPIPTEQLNIFISIL
jgi:hypothetical protein